jgi:hypothetical protein
MIRSIVKVCALSFFAAGIGGLPVQLLAQSTNKPSAEKKSASGKKETPKVEKKQSTLPYKGNLTAVDKTAKTITVGKRTFQITSETKIFRGAKPAKLEEGVTDEYLTLSYHKTDDEKFIAHNVYFGGKQAGKDAEKKKAKTEK